MHRFLGVNFQIKISWGLEASDPSEKQSFFEGKEVSASPDLDSTLQKVKSFALKKKGLSTFGKKSYTSIQHQSDRNHQAR